MLRLPDGSTRIIDEKRYGGNGMLVMDRAKGCCEVCGSNENVVIHHNNGYSNEPQDLICLCSKCHGIAHSNKYGGHFPPFVHPLSDKSKSIEKDKEKDNIYNEHFQEFWSAYPRKVDKKKAYKCYQTRLKEGFSEEELMQAAQNYADECKKENRDSKYIKHPSTFLGVDTPFTEYLKKGNENGEKNKATTGRQYTDEELDRFEQLL